MRGLALMLAASSHCEALHASLVSPRPALRRTRSATLSAAAAAAAAGAGVDEDYEEDAAGAVATAAAEEDESAWYFTQSHREKGPSGGGRGAISQHQLVWNRAPCRVLVLAKRHANEEELAIALKLVVLLQERGLCVLLANPLHGALLGALRSAGAEAPTYWKGDEILDDEIFDDDGDKDNLHPTASDTSRPDFITTLGGDGLLLYANALFQKRAPPPVIAFSAGSLGFLAPFDADAECKLESALDAVLARRDQGDCSLDSQPNCVWPVSLRMRLRCRIIEGATQRELARHEVLNEVVVDRGASPFLSAVECYCNDEHLTTAQADGLIIATPTGSTAYSLAAGGPMLHPSAPAIVFTPICPHSLSFRPIVFPDSATLRFDVDESARADAWVTFDGRRRLRLRRGDSLEVTASPHPLPTLLRHGNTADWFGALHEAFNFNRRVRQKPLTSSECADECATP